MQFLLLAAVVIVVVVVDVDVPHRGGGHPNFVRLLIERDAPH